MKKKFSILLSLSLVLTIGIYLVTARLYHLKEIYGGHPTQLVTTNITNQSVDIYWKSEGLEIPTLSYKQESYSGLYSNASISVYSDNTSDLNIYKATISDLEPDSKYLFRIEYLDNVWETSTDDTLLSFNTKSISDNPTLPNIATGESSIMDFLLISVNGEEYMVDTEYHGTWAMDIGDSDDYDVSEYGNYMSEDQLQALGSTLGITKAFAASGANCRTGSSAEYSDASKSTFVSIANNWTSCKGNYGSECYSDVVCRASNKNVNPAFALSTWLVESVASNYAYSSSVLDFGINGAGVPAANFDKQLDYYLNLVKDPYDYVANSTQYNSTCTYQIAGEQAIAKGADPNLTIFGALYFTGNPCNTDEGIKYMTSIMTTYKWLTGETLTFDSIKKTTNIPGCSFTGTNTTYKSCGGETTTSSSSSDSSSSNNATSTTGTLQCGQNGCTKDADCAGWESGDYECDETLSHKASDQYCRLIACPTGQQISADGCSCEKAEEYSIEIKEGVNFIIIEADPYSGTSKVTAKGLMNSNSGIISIGEYLGGSWSNLITKNNGTTSGEDFNLKGGRAYLVISEKDFDLEYYGIGTAKIDLSTLKGWTLVPTKAIGETSTKNIITDYNDLIINQIAVWDYSTSMFENLAKDVDGSFYGDNISLNNINTIFVRIE